MRRILVLIAIVTIFSACRSTVPLPDEVPVPDEKRYAQQTDPPAISSVLGESHLANLSYTVVSSSVRLALTRASVGFVVTLRDGEYLFPGSVASEGIRGVHADLPHVVYGDVNRDGQVDAVVPLLIEQGQDTILEVAAVSASGASAVHIASFPIGKATLKFLAVTDGKIRANFVQRIPGDPGPRNTELQLELPKQ